MSQAQLLSMVERIRKQRRSGVPDNKSPKTTRKGSAQPFDDGVRAAKAAIQDFEKELKKIK
jgi:hypothetical protein